MNDLRYRVGLIGGTGDGDGVDVSSSEMDNSSADVVTIAEGVSTIV